MQVLLTSVCRPFGPESGDASSVGYELLHKQVTRAQGIFSPRTVNVYFGLEYIAANLDAPTTVLHYPTRREFIRELKKGYDYIGVSFIMALFHKMKETVALIRRYSPQSKIVLGGYGALLDESLIAPYADYICREEGVAFFRRLLGRPEIQKPYKHPLLVNELKLFSLPISRTGPIFAGLGCPNGCDFCCTSHFFKRRHIKLLPEGKDIFDVIDRYWQTDPDMVFMIFDEDFLLNKKRAMEFRECVKQSGRLPSIFVFSSVKALSQYTVDEVLEMGIDGIWVGYEGTRSGYAKQAGRPVQEILSEFRRHGITLLTSMIVGFDYQTREVVEEELKGLMDLKPALAQFLIYGPVPGTPFYDRVMREDRLQEAYRGKPEEFFRRADGFTTMIKHPTLSPADIEGLQEHCFREDFEHLGPSVLRVVESWHLGYRQLKNAANPILREKSAFYARQIRKAYPLFLSGKLLGPNRAVRRWTRDLAEKIYADLGAPTVLERLKSLLVLKMALWTFFTLKAHLFQHPRLIRTVHNRPQPPSPIAVEDGDFYAVLTRFSI
jgi:haloalkane dehalogenase